MLRLMIRNGVRHGEAIQVDRCEKLTLGRGQDRGRLADAQVSRRHAEVAFAEPGCWIVRDLGSTNGTWINRHRIAEPTALEVGDQLRLGRLFLIVDAITDPQARRRTGPTPKPHAAEHFDVSIPLPSAARDAFPTSGGADDRDAAAAAEQTLVGHSPPLSDLDAPREDASPAETRAPVDAPREPPPREKPRAQARAPRGDAQTPPRRLVGAPRPPINRSTTPDPFERAPTPSQAAERASKSSESAETNPSRPGASEASGASGASEGATRLRHRVGAIAIAVLAIVALAAGWGYVAGSRSRAPARPAVATNPPPLGDRSPAGGPAPSAEPTASPRPAPAASPAVDASTSRPPDHPPDRSPDRPGGGGAPSRPKDPPRPESEEAQALPSSPAGPAPPVDASGVAAPASAGAGDDSREERVPTPPIDGGPSASPEALRARMTRAEPAVGQDVFAAGPTALGRAALAGRVGRDPSVEMAPEAVDPASGAREGGPTQAASMPGEEAAARGDGGALRRATRLAPALRARPAPRRDAEADDLFTPPAARAPRPAASAAGRADPGGPSIADGPASASGSGEADTTVFLADASGSMIDSMASVLEVLRQRVAALPAGDRFAVIFFQSGRTVAFDPEGPVVIDDSSRGRALAWLSDPWPIEPAGASDLGSALDAALAWEPDRVVLVSDGDFPELGGDRTTELEALSRLILRGGVSFEAVQMFYPAGESLLRSLAGRVGGAFQRFEPERPREAGADLLVP